MRTLSILLLAIALTVPGLAKKDKNPHPIATHPTPAGIQHATPQGFKRQSHPAPKRKAPKVPKKSKQQ
jgi:hypothetical protein